MTEKKPVAFMQHGITDSADCFIVHYQDVAPAFKLLRAGYDVWLGNQRGTKYSLGHRNLSLKDKAYWEFSFTEMGKYDAPAQVDYVRKHTG
jgi:pimeloyl-ACP methyl ester carboxylesterase